MKGLEFASVADNWDMLGLGESLLVAHELVNVFFIVEENDT